MNCMVHTAAFPPLAVKRQKAFKWFTYLWWACRTKGEHSPLYFAGSAKLVPQSAGRTFIRIFQRPGKK